MPHSYANYEQQLCKVEHIIFLGIKKALNTLWICIVPYLLMIWIYPKIAYYTTEARAWCPVCLYDVSGKTQINVRASLVWHVASL